MTEIEQKARALVRKEDGHGYLNYDAAFAALCRAIEQIEDLRQPTHSEIFGVGDVTKHTLIVDPSYTAHTFKVKSLEDSQPPQSDAQRKTPIWNGRWDGNTARSDALREVVIEECAKALEADAMKCDCAALEERECGCGAWCEWKSITSARAVEIVLALKGKEQ